MTEFAEWENFYVIVGSSAGALIGLQFVVMSLVAGKQIAASESVNKALATPTIVHFGAVLLLSALISAPWHGFAALAALWGLIGLSGVIYVVTVVVRHLLAQTDYKAVFEDWLFHVLLPFTAYAVLVVSAVIAFSHLRAALFCAGASALLLLFDGIHNAWDSVLYLLFVKNGKKPE
jgi:hypothetical protein